MTTEAQDAKSLATAAAELLAVVQRIDSIVSAVATLTSTSAREAHLYAELDVVGIELERLGKSFSSAAGREPPQPWLFPCILCSRPIVPGGILKHARLEHGLEVAEA